MIINGSAGGDAYLIFWKAHKILPKLVKCNIKKDKSDSQAPPYPSQPVAGGRAGPEVMGVGELAVPLTGYSTQDGSRTSLGNTEQILLAEGMRDLALRLGDIPLSGSGMGKEKMSSPQPLVTCSRWES